MKKSLVEYFFGRNLVLLKYLVGKSFDEIIWSRRMFGQIKILVIDIFDPNCLSRDEKNRSK